ERDEADVPEREHAGVADEDVEADDDRHADQRVEEIDLRRTRRDVSEERSREHEDNGGGELRDSLPHRRSAGPPWRVKSPCGRTSRTRITAAKRNESRYWL